MNNLGDCYETGSYVEQDFAKARECYEKAVELGEMFGYASIGGLYENGHGVEKDLEKAAEYYQLALEKGCADAQQFLDALRAFE